MEGEAHVNNCSENLQHGGNALLQQKHGQAMPIIHRYDH